MDFVFLAWSVIESVLGIYMLLTYSNIALIVSGIAVESGIAIASIVFLCKYGAQKMANKKVVKKKKKTKTSKPQAEGSGPRFVWEYLYEDGKWYEFAKDICAKIEAVSE